MNDLDAAAAAEWNDPRWQAMYDEAQGDAVADLRRLLFGPPTVTESTANGADNIPSLLSVTEPDRISVPTDIRGPRP